MDLRKGTMIATVVASAAAYLGFKWLQQHIDITDKFPSCCGPDCTCVEDSK